jgi:hypothetical protein
MISFAETINDSGFEFDTSTGTIVSWTGYDINLIIPSKIAGVDVTNIGEYAFAGSYVEAVSIPDSVVSIGRGAFSNTYLHVMTIPDGVKSIGREAFSFCSMLNSITIPSSVIYIEGYLVFNSPVSEINVSPENTKYSSVNGVLYDKNQTILIECPRLGIPGTIPDTIVQIGDWAFGFNQNIKEITIPKNVTTIGYSAFQMSSLEKVTISGKVTEIKDDAFGSSELTSIDVDPQSVTYSSFDGILYNKSQTALLLCPERKDVASFTIPESVTSIGKSAFERCNITNIFWPTSLASIGEKAFLGCDGLTNVTLPNSLISIGADAFSGIKLLSISVPASVTSIGKGALNSCYKSVNVDTANTVYSSIDGVLYDKIQSTLIFCPPEKGYQTFYVPNNVTIIADNAF